MDEPRLKLGLYLFAKHGGKIIFFGRFIAVLRALAAVLAGANRYPWGRFFAFNAAGGIVGTRSTAAPPICWPTPCTKSRDHRGSRCRSS